MADGTRFIRVKFPKEMVSLPYNTHFETEEGAQIFRVIHDQQVKICRIFSRAEHEKKDCPQLTCRECLGGAGALCTGLYSREVPRLQKGIAKMHM